MRSALIVIAAFAVVAAATGNVAAPKQTTPPVPPPEQQQPLHADLRIGGGRGHWRHGYGWIYPGMSQVVVAPPTYGYYGTTMIPGTQVVQQPTEQVIYTQQPAPTQVIYTGGGVAAAPAATTVQVAAPATTATTVAAAPTTVVAGQPAATSYVTAAAAPQVMTTTQLVPEMTYASPYYFGAGSPIVYPGYRGFRSWYRHGRGFVVPPSVLSTLGGYGYGGGTVLGATGGVVVPPIYIGGGFGGRFGHHHRGRLEAKPMSTQKNPIPPQPTQANVQASGGSLPTTTIRSDNPSADIMTLGNPNALTSEETGEGDSGSEFMPAGQNYA